MNTLTEAVVKLLENYTYYDRCYDCRNNAVCQLRKTYCKKLIVAVLNGEKDFDVLHPIKIKGE